MTRVQHRGSFVLTEGKADLRVFDRVIDQERCQLEPAHSKANVLGAVAILEADTFPGVLGIIDADRSRVSGDLPPSGNILLTDGCDLESMLLRSPALGKVLAELGSAKKIERFESDRGTSVRDHLAALARPIGALRYVSEQENFGLRFQQLSFSKFVCRELRVLDQPELVRTVKNKSRLPNLDERLLIAKLERIETDHRISSWDLSNGHDMVEILALGLRKALGSRNQAEVSTDVLERSLRLAYEKQYFLKTGLRASIRAWEGRNQAYTVLS